MTRELIRSSAFIRAFRRIIKKNPDTLSRVENALSTLKQDAFDPRVKTHKLKGQLEGVWACTAGHDLRILFEFVVHEEAEAILLLTIGTHDEVY